MQVKHFRVFVMLWLTIFAIATVLISQNPPAPTTPPSSSAGVKPLTKEQNDRLVISYQQGLLAQINLAEAQRQLQDATQEHMLTQTAVAKEAGMPDGTVFQVDLRTKRATPILPAASVPTAPKTTPAAKDGVLMKKDENKP